MLLLNVFTLDKNNERLTRELSPEDLIIVTKLQVSQKKSHVKQALNMNGYPDWLINIVIPPS